MSELKIEYRKLNQLKEWDKNPRSINKDAFQRLKRQIVMLGIYKPSIVDQENMLLGGNMRFKAWLSLKEDQQHIPAAPPAEQREYYDKLRKMDFTKLPVIVRECAINAEPKDLTDDKEIDPEKLLGDHTIECPKCGFEFDPKANDDQSETE